MLIVVMQLRTPPRLPGSEGSMSKVQRRDSFSTILIGKFASLSARFVRWARAEFPAEFLAMSIEDVLRSRDSTVRKLLLDRRVAR
jgi:hypothetical protein